MRLVALIGSVRDAFGALEPLPAAALPVDADLAAVAAGAALWSSAADCPGSWAAEVVACSGVDDEPPHAAQPGGAGNDEQRDVMACAHGYDPALNITSTR